MSHEALGSLAYLRPLWKALQAFGLNSLQPWVVWAVLVLAGTCTEILIDMLVAAVGDVAKMDMAELKFQSSVAPRLQNLESAIGSAWRVLGTHHRLP